jgi:hypothetical protein
MVWALRTIADGAIGSRYRARMSIDSALADYWQQL